MKRALAGLMILGLALGLTGAVGWPEDLDEAVRPMLTVGGFADDPVELKSMVTLGASFHLDGNFYYPHLRFGVELPVWDNMYIRIGGQTDAVFTPLHSWWIAEFMGKFHLHEQFSILAGPDFAVELTRGRITDAYWTMAVGPHWAPSGMNPGLGFWMQGHIPMPRFDPTDPLMGMYFSGGIEFRW